jgi:hypothetical protein
MSAPEPVIVRGCPGTSHSRRVALADILILAADHRDARVRFADLFSRYPGLTLVAVVIAAQGCLRAGLRDGTVVTVRFTLNASVDVLARAVYLWWSESRGQPGDPFL